MMAIRGVAAPSLLAVVVVLLLAGAVPARAASVSVAAADVAVISNPGNEGEVRSLMRFELPEGLAGTSVEFAVVEFRASVTSPDVASDVTLDAFPVTTEWIGDSVAWAEGWSTPGGDFDASVHAVWAAVTGPSSVVRFDVTDVARGWCSGARENHGLIVLVAPGEGGAALPSGGWGDGGSAPVLNVWYSGTRRAVGPDG